MLLPGESYKHIGENYNIIAPRTHEGNGFPNPWGVLCFQFSTNISAFVIALGGPTCA
jgi:hypothetical protein